MKNKLLLTVLIPTTALAGSLGYALAQGEHKLGGALAIAILLIIVGFFIAFKRK